MRNLFKDKDDELRFLAVRTLYRLRVVDKDIMPTLAEGLRNPTARGEVLVALSQAGPEAQELVPVLKELLKDNGAAAVRPSVIGILVRLDPRTPELVPELSAVIKSANPAGLNELQARGAADKLGELGPEAKAAVPILIGALKGRDASLRSMVVLALGKIGPDAAEAVPALMEACKDDPTIAAIFYETLGHIGPAAKEAVPLLRQVLRDTTPKDDPSDLTVAQLERRLRAAYALAAH